MHTIAPPLLLGIGNLDSIAQRCRIFCPNGVSCPLMPCWRIPVTGKPAPDTLAQLCHIHEQVLVLLGWWLSHHGAAATQHLYGVREGK